jgi:uncharacterized protein YoaH (UPF0181 family)
MARFLRELIREDKKRRAEEGLEALLAEGLSSGEPLKADRKYWAEKHGKLFEPRRNTAK